MKIERLKVELITITQNAEQLIEQCARTCYKSQGQVGDTFIKMLIDKGHHSQLEHASATFKLTCDRGVTHELVRHRLASYSQESTRFCNYSKEKFSHEITVIEPPTNTYTEREIWKSSCETVEKGYMELISSGVKPQIARSVLPICLKTEIVITANLREWRHILKLRTSLQAHTQMREIMYQIRAILKKECPSVFYDF